MNNWGHNWVLMERTIGDITGFSKYKGGFADFTFAVYQPRDIMNSKSIVQVDKFFHGYIILKFVYVFYYYRYGSLNDLMIKKAGYLKMSNSL